MDVNTPNTEQQHLLRRLYAVAERARDFPAVGEDTSVIKACEAAGWLIRVCVTHKGAADHLQITNDGIRMCHRMYLKAHGIKDPREGDEA